MALSMNYEPVLSGNDMSEKYRKTYLLVQVNLYTIEGNYLLNSN